MRSPDDNPSQTAGTRFQCREIANAAFVQVAVVIDYQNFAGLRALQCFQKNIDASKMSDR